MCRRQSTVEVEEIVRFFSSQKLRLHGFGVKVSGLREYADVLSSSDSLAWSMKGRYVPGCAPGHRTESNCLSFALDWYQRIRDAMPAAGVVDPTACPEPLSRAA